VAGLDACTLELLERLARHHWSFVLPTAAFVLLGARVEGDAPGTEARLRGGYEEFVRSLREPFPVECFEPHGTTGSYAEQLLDRIVALGRS
jgi:hypothetical protein